MGTEGRFNTLKRYQDIIAFKDPVKKSADKSNADNKRLTHSNENTYIAFHASNLEVAEISEETFKEMSFIDLSTGLIPPMQETLDPEAKLQLNDWNNEINPDVKKGEIHFGIRNITLNVTQVCNLHCTYCAAGGDGTYGEPLVRLSVEKTIPQLKFLLDSLKPKQKFRISFVGGEPLLYPEGIKILATYVTEIAQQKNITAYFSLITNGTVFNEKVAALFRTIPIDLTVSIDGPAEINDLLRPSKTQQSPTALIVKNIEQLKSLTDSKLQKIGTSAVYSDSRQNILDIYAFFKTLDVDWYEFNFSTTSIDPNLQKKYLAEMDLLAEQVWREGQEHDLLKIKTFSTYFHFLDQQQQIENFCGAGKSYVAIDAQNRIYPCVWEAGDKASQIGEGAQINRQAVESLQKPLIVLNNCQTCWARYLCGGGCMYINKVKNGDRHKKNTLFCERTRHLILVTLMYYKRARGASYEKDSYQEN